jgi:integrase
MDADDLAGREDLLQRCLNRIVLRQIMEAGMLVEKEYVFDEWADMWFDNHKDNISPTTQESYSYTLKILKDYFGRRKLKDIKAYDIEQLLKKLRRDGRSDSCLTQCRGMLYQIFNKAEANDLVLKNPVRFADKMRKGPKKRKESFTADEVKVLMEQLPQNKIGWSIRLMLATGMRTQELLALEPRHIKEDGSRIVIEQALKRVKGSVDIGPPKSQDSFRTIPVPVSVRHCARFLAATDTMFIWEGKYKDKPCNPTHFADLYKKALTEIEGMRYLSPHCCRHTYVSQMQALGVDLATIQSIVGHADIDMTKHYLHVQESIRQAAIEKFSEAFMVEEDQMQNSSHLVLIKSS